MIQETEWKQQPARMVGTLDSAKFIGRKLAEKRGSGQDVRAQTPIYKGLGGESK